MLFMYNSSLFLVLMSQMLMNRKDQTLYDFDYVTCISRQKIQGHEIDLNAKD